MACSCRCGLFAFASYDHVSPEQCITAADSVCGRLYANRGKTVLFCFYKQLYCLFSFFACSYIVCFVVLCFFSVLGSFVLFLHFVGFFACFVLFCFFLGGGLFGWVGFFCLLVLFCFVVLLWVFFLGGGGGRGGCKQSYCLFLFASSYILCIVCFLFASS